MDVPLIAAAVFLALVTVTAGVEVFRGRPFVARASAPALLGRLLLAGGLTANQVGQLVAEHAVASTAVKVLGTGLLAGGVAQLGAHWVREGYRSAIDAREAAAREAPAAVLVRPDVLRVRRAQGVLADADRLGELIEATRRGPLPPLSLSAARADELVREIRADRDNS